MIRNSTSTYGSVAKFFHWVLFVLIGGMLVFGYFLDDFPKDVQPLTYNIHKLTGLTILLLMVLRLCWKLINPTPVLPADTKPWERKAEHLVQYGLYFFLLLMPIVGWIGSCAAGHPPRLGDFEFNLPIAQSKTVDDVAFWLHNNIALVLIALVSIHFVAALFHYFIKRDNVLRRML